jgi:Holliday junction resolvasome RuvABC ATP-dependent DNA helicase subunit
MSDFVLKLNADADAEIDVSYIDKVIGQEEAKKKLAFFAKSHCTDTPFPTLLFTGSQGLGKTYMSQKVADSLGRELVEVNCGSIRTAQDFVEQVWVDKILFNGDQPRTLLLDEAHNLPFDVTTLLLSFLNPNDENKNIVDVGDYHIEYNFKAINIIFATTDAHMMFKPLLNRCTEIYFNKYERDELCDILKMYLPKIKIDVEDKDDLADACRGRARDAFILSQNIKRYCHMEKTKTFCQKCWNGLKGLFGIHAKGLNSQEIRFLNVLKEYGTLSSRNIAMRMGVNVKNIEGELEIHPRVLGLITSTSKGRSLTEAGIAYLN